MRRKRAGSEAEALAADFLRERGYSIIGRNVRYPFGEIDIVALKEETVVFVEVRSTSGNDITLPLESINTEKIKRVTRAAYRFLQGNPELQRLQVRFDCMIVRGPESSPRLSWIKNAFEPSRL